MKIGIACHSVYGGSSVVASELGIALAQRGHEIHFISFTLPFRLQSYQSHVFYHEIERMSYPLFKDDPYSLSIAVKMAEVAKQTNLDVLHVHYAIPFATCAYLAKKMLEKFKDLKIITTLHGTDITIVGNDKSFFGITKFSIEQSDVVTAVSNYLKDMTIQNFGIERKIEVIYNFINPDKYRPDFCIKRRGEFASEDEKLLIHISNFRPVKRLTDVVQVFYNICQQIPAKLMLVGDGPDRIKAYELINQLNIQDRVIFLGKQDCVIGLLSISDLLLLPSENESFGLAALEAMSCEVPVITTNTGGTPEVVVDGVTGYMSPIGDTKKMSDDALKILNDPSLHTEMKKNSRLRAITHFSESAMINKYEQIYRKMIEN